MVRVVVVRMEGRMERVVVMGSWRLLERVEAGERMRSRRKVEG